MDLLKQKVKEAALEVVAEIGDGGLVTAFSELLSYYYEHTQMEAAQPDTDEDLRECQSRRLSEYMALLPYVAKASEVISRAAALE